MAYAIERKNGRWTGMYYDADKRARSAGTFDSKNAAIDVATDMEAFVEQGAKGVSPSSRASVTIEEYAPTWLHNHMVEPNTKANYASVLKTRIIPTFGKTRVAELQRQDVRAYLMELANQGQAVTMQKRVRAILSAMMQTAWDDGYRNDNPVRGLRVAKSGRKQIVVMTTDQFQGVHRQLPTRGAKLLARLIVNSGMRFSEATEFRVRDLDVDTAILHVNRTVQDCGPKYHPNGKDRFYVTDYTKTGDSRKIPLNKPTLKALTDWIVDHGLSPDDLVFPAEKVILENGRTRARLDRPELTEEYIATLGTVVSPKNGRTYQHGTVNGYVLGCCREECCRHAANTYRKNRNLHARIARRPSVTLPPRQPYLGRDRWGEIWKRACKASGLPFSPTAYQLRHTHASWLINAGVDPMVVMSRLGHKDLSTTSLYVHMVDEGRSAADAMDDLDLDLDE